MFTSHNLWLHTWLGGYQSTNLFARHVENAWVVSRVSDDYDALCVLLGGEPI